jgi:hypothetical protein
LFPGAAGRPDGDPLASSLVREQAYEIIEAVLSGTDAEGAEIRERRRDHVAAYPGRPEAALQEPLSFTRSLARALCLHPRLAVFLERSPLELTNVVLEPTDPLRGRKLSPLMDSLTPLRGPGCAWP